MKDENSIQGLPVEVLISEAISQRNRIATEVMQALFALLPDHKGEGAPFQLADGTKCWLKKFAEPYKNHEGTLQYGFDVCFDEGHTLDHMEFSVRCTGWGRAYTAPVPVKLP